MNAVEELKDYGEGEFSIHFISSQERTELVGFEHILTNIPFLYNCS